MAIPSVDNILDDFFNRLRQLAYVTFGAATAKTVLGRAVEKFVESESLPVKINYIDWWPKTCQKVKEVALSIWNRRMEGASATTFTGGVLTTACLLQSNHPGLKTIWNIAKFTNRYVLNFFGMGGFPDIATLATLPSIFGGITSLCLGVHDVYSKQTHKDNSLETKPIFNPTLQDELDEILTTTCINKEENGILQNLMLYGPPGTGKTMISKWIAKNSNMNYILLSGGDLLKTLNSQPGQATQAGAGGAVALLQKLMEIAKNCSSPTVIFIDEAEACLGRRDQAKGQELISLLNAFLELTGQPSSKVMLILATNRPETIDSAVLSRMDYKIHVAIPDLEERKQIINRAVEILFPASQEKPIFSPKLIDHIAKQTNGFSGRDLFKLVNRLKAEARIHKVLTPESIDKSLAKFVRQEHQIQTHNSAYNPLTGNSFFKAAAAAPGA